MNEHLSISELQNRGKTGDERALAELGRRVLDIDFDFDITHYCQYRDELIELQEKLDREPPPDCPKCGHWLTDA